MNDALLVLGIPRSGTTWLCEVLGSCRGHEVVLEPDNEKTSFLAWRLKRHVPRFPTLAKNANDDGLGCVWDYAAGGRFARSLCRGQLSRCMSLFDGQVENSIAARERAAVAGQLAARSSAPIHQTVDGRKGVVRGRRRILKTVHSAFCSEWVARRIAATQVVVIERHPLAVIASMKRMSMDDSFRPGSLWPHLDSGERELLTPYATATDARTDIRVLALHVLKMHQQLRAAVQRNPQWALIRFEDFCAAPVDGFRDLFSRIGCEWSSKIEADIQSKNRAGSGYQTGRIASDQIASWKREFSASELEAVESLFACYRTDFPTLELQLSQSN